MPHEASELEPVLHALQAQVKIVAARCSHVSALWQGQSFGRPLQSSDARRSSYSRMSGPPSGMLDSSVCFTPPPLPARDARKQDTDDYSTWETRYGLLLWLSMLSLVPFDIDTIDSGLGDAPPDGGGGMGASGAAGGGKGAVAPVAAVGDTQADLVGTILSLGMKHLGDAGPTRYACLQQPRRVC